MTGKPPPDLPRLASSFDQKPALYFHLHFLCMILIFFLSLPNYYKRESYNPIPYTLLSPQSLVFPDHITSTLSAYLNVHQIGTPSQQTFVSHSSSSRAQEFMHCIHQNFPIQQLHQPDPTSQHCTLSLNSAAQELFSITVDIVGDIEPPKLSRNTSILIPYYPHHPQDEFQL